MALGDKYEVVVCCYTPDQIAINRSYWRWDASSGSGATLAQIAAAFDATFAPVYKAWMSDQARYRGVTIRPITVPTSSATPYVASDGPGTIAQDLAPTQVSGVISFRTPFAGPGYRGRVYPGFPPKTFGNAQGKMTAAGAVVLAQISAAYAVAVVAGFGGNSATFQLAVRHANVPPAAPTFYAVQEVTTRDRFATQRRRGQFGRINSLPF